MRNAEGQGNCIAIRGAEGPSEEFSISCLGLSGVFRKASPAITRWVFGTWEALIARNKWYIYMLVARTEIYLSERIIKWLDKKKSTYRLDIRDSSICIWKEVDQ